MILHRDQYSNYEFEVLVTNPEYETWAQEILAETRAIIDSVPEAIDSTHRVHSKWSFGYPAYVKVREYMSGLGKLPKYTDAHICLSRYNGGLLTKDGINPISAYGELPGIPNIQTLRSTITYAIGNMPYVTTGYTFPFGPSDLEFVELWGKINSKGYIKLDPRHLKGKIYNGKSWKFDTSIKEAARQILKQ
jgi:hypothetical protein